MINLKEKNCLVTGGSRGIGKSIALTLAKAGANVAITYASSADAAAEVVKNIENEGVKGISYQADAVQFDRAEEVISDIVENWGSLNVVVNNAGITKDNLILRMDEKAWDDVITTNLKSVFNYSKAAAKPMMRARGGSIINISSVVGLSGNAGQSNYAASKAGIVGFTKSYAKELASRNIRANVVAPGYILTEMTENLNEKVLEAIKEETPLGRAGTPEEVSNVVAFLASDISSYITGEVIRVDGGMAM
ncbi:3-oxoacyl-[acyl-carrier-protein] reductase [Rhodohalobacter sulfatireducens]|uniref:3-oxoacyl-[acyl-carrier-protein] reductase n=1 Tax=Rhodohalobacter sulfatireducens TaxID=2911366 RepID=A0ABS9KF83_9BACT|nr:3-oxoacyl-[acyl-carrier-protein] reductase [Rhodohalobacter sulfatireducens]MCG2589493.1 3-oxoacyl-[acyl-carrier-protein] reductase [Rhodohalobacter sulfatireducens]MDR9363776.1 3-oxoacyl-[acyl-carrier-protein] reductase [Balneolaceae bacterium]MDR9408848.1 3-oxoacyl-[acyl-carrier-protein] reductase [Balneolaceae bacterium]